MRGVKMLGRNIGIVLRGVVCLWHVGGNGVVGVVLRSVCVSVVVGIVLGVWCRHDGWRVGCDVVCRVGSRW